MSAGSADGRGLGFWRTLRLVWSKEVRENLRDRRTVYAALLGPLLGPLLLGFMLQFMVERGGRDFDAPVTLPIVNAARAPNLTTFLESRGVTLERLEADDADSRERVLSRRSPMVLSVPEDYGARLAAGEPAPLMLYLDASSSSNERYVRRIRTLIGEYSRELVTLRLLARGVDPVVLAPVPVQDVDVSTPASRSVVVLGMLSFFMLTAMLTGGMYLAIDSTAGERERGTLEPLLTLPVSRTALIYGKILATCTFMLLSLVLTTVAFAIRLRFVGLERLGMTANLGLDVVLLIVAAVLPLIPAGAAMMTVLASFTRSYREAQAWLSFILLVPTLPLVFATMLDLTPSLRWMSVPVMSQNFLITGLLRGDAIPLLHVVLSVSVTLVLAAVLWLLAGRLYRREKLLG